MAKTYELSVYGVMEACKAQHVLTGEHVADQYLKQLLEGWEVTIPSGARLVPVSSTLLEVVHREEV